MISLDLNRLSEFATDPIACEANNGAVGSRQSLPFITGKLWSLWEMLQFDLTGFTFAIRDLAAFEKICQSRVLAGEGDNLVAQADAKPFLKGFLEPLAKYTVNFDLDAALVTVKQWLERIDRTDIKMPNYREAEAWIGELRRRIEDQLSSRSFHYLTASKAALLVKDPPPFGEAVRNKFPLATKDIEDAGRCLAFGLSTAAVFHLMRVLEVGIQRMAKRLRVPRNRIKNKTWETVLRELNSAIAALTAPGAPNLTTATRKLRDRGAEATAFLMNVKIAWRNTVMHAERTYDDEEAKAIFDATKAFIGFLATEVF